MKKSTLSLFRRAAVVRAACVVAVVFGMALAGCQPARQPAHPEPPVRDLVDLPQSAWGYVDPERAAEPLLAPEEASRQAAELLRLWFSPWHRTAPAAKAEHVFAYLGTDPDRLFGEDTRALGRPWLARMTANADAAAYPNAGYPAIAVRHSSLRALPTLRPAFRDSALPGEGWPFDMLQNSGVWAQTPLYVSHVSRDGAWVMAETHFASGWMPASDVAPVDAQVMAAFEEWPMAAFVRDHVSVIDTAGAFRFEGRVGMLLPLVGECEDQCDVLLAVRGELGRAVLATAEISSTVVASYPQIPTQGALAHVADEMLGQSYGWGGLYEDRDCSATLMDLFVPFGIRLPRNSYSQSRAGTFVSFDGLDAQQRTQLIERDGVPWMTLLWRRGHIMLYVGSRQGRPAILHTMWGVKIEDSQGREARRVVGRTVVTSLAPGEELPELVRPAGIMLNVLGGMTMLPPKVAPKPQVVDGVSAELTR
ncbi:cell wall-associated NlpC family hydrolase [Desulfobaculum xiamenense]|uniref:Cell wall-associated NlpC family hydrolase n=1 Tax=Desulfobaculum xiamenense TaxID=995050 RepID=A0A846QHR8_9BACT|nr:SH3 domain-containing protein [Desulfobaculum xiamenense]NJB68386.1 cell wall-associated NlpC family hydrolase [Desulfobaculum xiamenense]